MGETCNILWTLKYCWFGYYCVSVLQNERKTSVFQGKKWEYSLSITVPNFMFEFNILTEE